ncbi:hypothetical protein MalM25_30390 [Planctomycetes bacterium MalM25]|nr:hypothetical protein MalM25_30390 [Planctomycetes bacterium MalM25]
MMLLRAITLGILVLGSASNSIAGLTFYYDPDTGNVSFDTANTVSGGLYLYGLGLNPNRTDIRFRHENHVRISNSTIFFTTPEKLSDLSLSEPVEGLITIGDVLPTGISEDQWLSLFSGSNRTGPYLENESTVGGYLYTAEIGCWEKGCEEISAEFIYGAPNRDFDNRWDLVDPDEIPWASKATLIYRSWSGEVVLDTTGADGGHISSFLLQSDGQFLPDNYKKIAPGLSLPRDTTLGLIADAIEPGSYSLGQILSPGMAEDEFAATFTTASFLGRAGFQGGSFDFEADGVEMELVFLSVPEPSAFVLSFLASLVFLQRRTR